MTVIRELTTRLGFQVDRSGFSTIERALSSFRSRITVNAFDLKNLAFDAVNFFGEIAKGNVDLKDLARNTKTPLENLIALREAAKNFRFEPAQFDSAFTRLSNLLSQAKSGYGELFEIARKSRGELNLTPFIQTGDVQGAFLATVKYLESLKNVDEQLRAIRDIYGPGNENGLLRIVEAGGNAFLKAADDQREYAKQVAASIPDQESYLKKINELSNSFDRLKESFAAFTFPALTKGTNVLDTGFKGLNLIEKDLSKNGLDTALNRLVQQTADSIYRLIGIEPSIDVQNRIYQEDAEFYRQLREYQNQQNLMPSPMNVTNNIQVSVSPGTDVEQRKELAETIRLEMESFYDEKNREVINNSPQVE